MKFTKKILIIISIFLFGLTINNISVKADMSAPEMREFEIEVIDPEGVDYYNYKNEVAGHLNKGDRVYVMYDYNGKYTLGISTTKYGVERKESIGDVNSLDGFEIVEDTVDPTLDLEDKSIKKFDTAQKALVYAKDGVDVYKGPSDVYEKVGHIEKGTRLTYKYAITGYEGSTGMTYIYIKYGDINGWISILKGSVLIENDTQFVFKEDVETECGVIPGNTVTTPIYKTDQWTHKAVFKYNDCEVLLNTLKDDKVLSIYSGNYIAKKDLNIYKTSDKTSEIIGTIPAGSEFKYLAGLDYSIDGPTQYFKYNDIIGWNFDSYDSYEYVSFDEEPTRIEDTLVIEETKEEPEEQQVVQKKVGLNTFIILCAFGVGLLIITALVTIILVNKSKKDNNNTNSNTEEK